MIEATQCRIVRDLLSWFQGDLIDHGEMSAAMIRALKRNGPMRDSNRNLLRMPFEVVGIVFNPADGEDVGMRLRNRRIGD